MTHANPARWIAAREITVALHIQTIADLLGADWLKRLGKSWAASAARRWLQEVANVRAQVHPSCRHAGKGA
jgi:hypothetical protein